MSDEELRDLLQTARDALRETILPQLARDDRYIALMVANALAIAERALSPELRGAEENALSALYGAEALERNGAAALLRTLADDIRQGRADGTDAHAERIHAALEALTRARVTIANPRALER